MNPRLHHIHHSQCKGECDSNWSSGFAAWIAYMALIVRNAGAERQAIAIGVPDYEASRLRLQRLLALPFQHR